MFVGFIAVVVILLVIVGLMSSGATNGSGGVDQTKATKALSEVSALVQSTGFYKTTTAMSNYAGLTVDTLVTNGIVASTDIVAANATTKDDAGVVVVGNVVKSKAVDGLFYKISEGANTAQMKMEVVVDSAKISATVQAGLAKALDSSYGKLTDSAVSVTNTATTDGAVALEFN